MKAFRLLLRVHDPLLHRNLEHRHAVNLKRPNLRVFVLLHMLRLHGNIHESCANFFFLVRVGRNSEHTTLRHLLFSGSVTAFSKADAIIVSRISKSGKLECLAIDRDVTSSSIDLAISTSLIQSIVTRGSAVRIQASVLKLIFQL